jgi:signal transduction histidine kinase
MKGRHTVLVLDDEPNVVRSVQDLLRLDYRVLGATRADEAMSILREEEVHVIMTDQRMPGMSGVEFLHRVRGDHPEAIRLLFTGHSDIGAVIAAINQGSVYRYITKPWDPQELQTIIREAVERYDLIVERRRLLEELQRKNRELESKNALLRQSDALKESFIHVASHELRTPLTVLLGLTWLARRVKGAPALLTEYLQRVDRAGQSLHRLVDQLTAMLSAGQFERSLDLRDVDLGALLRGVLDEVNPFATLREQELVADLPAGLGSMPLEAAKIHDSVHNLLMNAIKFTPDRGRVSLSARRCEDGGAEISVSDNGVGIPLAQREHLFSPFFTGFDSLHHSSGQFQFGARGVGLGLSVTREFVAMHGGTVTVESEVGRGSTFTIRLPGRAAQQAVG